MLIDFDGAQYQILRLIINVNSSPNFHVYKPYTALSTMVMSISEYLNFYKQKMKLHCIWKKMNCKRKKVIKKN